jgi:fumarylacetoacetate (FAA) hydrolase family protein
MSAAHLDSLTSRHLPEPEATLVGRVFDPVSNRPRVVGLHRGILSDLSSLVATVSELLDRPDAVALVRNAPAAASWAVEAVLEESLLSQHDDRQPWLLAPIDLQVIKACGVTFAASLIERLIEEKAGGDASRAQEVREAVTRAIGSDLLALEPGSDKAAAAKEELQQRGIWSQYLEVGIGPDPEVFTKGPVLSAVGFGQQIGVPAFSQWSNPEPELVLIVDSRGEARGATLGNDVNLRDVEGRSALLLGMAKDNNGSTAIGPFVRLFDESFTIETLRDEVVELTIEGVDGFALDGTSRVAEISRPFESLIAAAFGAHHQYPDGFALFTGTLFAPTQDRHQPGSGFTHVYGDRVQISSPHLGRLVNVVGRAEEIPRWEFGISALMRSLAIGQTSAAMNTPTRGETE